MFDHLRPDLFDNTAALRRFLAGNGSALICATTMLAGKRGERLARELTETVPQGEPLTRRQWQQLSDLRDILSLRYVDNPEREEAALFAALDPSAPYVEDICLLTDQFREALEQAGPEQPAASRNRSAT